MTHVGFDCDWYSEFQEKELVSSGSSTTAITVNEQCVTCWYSVERGLKSQWPRTGGFGDLVEMVVVS